MHAQRAAAAVGAPRGGRSRSSARSNSVGHLVVRGLADRGDDVVVVGQQHERRQHRRVALEQVRPALGRRTRPARLSLPPVGAAAKASAVSAEIRSISRAWATRIRSSLLATRPYIEPVETPDARATSTSVNDAEPRSTSSATAASRARSNDCRLRACWGSRTSGLAAHGADPRAVSRARTRPARCAASWARARSGVDRPCAEPASSAAARCSACSPATMSKASSQ